MGSLLAGQGVMGAIEAGRILGRTAAAQPGRDALAECVQDAGELPADRSGQRMAVAPAVVPGHGDGGSAGRRYRVGADRQTLSLSGQANGAQDGVVFGPAAALAGPVWGAL